jgi:hypothetical protein
MTNKCGHKMKGFKPKVQVKEIILWDFFFPYFFKKEIKESKMPTSSFLVLEAKHYNSKTTFAFFPINLSKGAKLILSLNFKLVNMAEFNASFNN